MTAQPEPQGLLFVFEGPDGVGKTTLSKRFAEHLHVALGVPCEWFAFPGHEPASLGKLVYDLHHNPSRFRVKTIHPASMQLLHLAAHIDLIETRILPALRKGTAVVLDRFWWSMLAYGESTGLGPELLHRMLELEALHWGSVVPNVVFVLERTAPFGEQLTLKWGSLSEQYRRLAVREAGRYTIKRVLNENDVNETLRELVAAAAGQIHTTKAGARHTRVATPPGPPECRAGSRAPARRIHSIVRLAPAQPTIVYDTYWRFAAERQAIFFRRLSGEKPPWTEDVVLQQYKFTNAYRASDRTSQFLIREVIYNGTPEPSEICFRVLLFKIFNRIETWNLLRHNLGPISYKEFSPSAYDRVLNEALGRREPIYSAAYIMPSGGRVTSYSRKHQMHLRLIERMMRDELPVRIAEATSMGKAFELLRAYPTIGDFLAYQYVTDLNYSSVTNFTEGEFVVAGPGARDGIHKCFSNLGGLNENEIIKFVADRQQFEAARLGLDLATLWGRPLQLIDCQNVFCEVSKYARVVHPEVAGKTGRLRIKQKFRPLSEPIAYFYPPKWGLNDKIAKGSLASVLDI
jgi:thymidylate kinase